MVIFDTIQCQFDDIVLQALNLIIVLEKITMYLVGAMVTNIKLNLTL